jgi:hypothetical protein
VGRKEKEKRRTFGSKDIIATVGAQSAPSIEGAQHLVE